ncbi:MAG: hypothetical protein RMJ56_16630 [Gemmataceae bacterium]|nr:hypothetical protein [Gemmata sp.]MDW8199224.1 hypothetical protein [Gemmataceae bacterium]
MTPHRLFPWLASKTYGTFTLTDAIRPSERHPLVPRQGYRIGVYRDPRVPLRWPMLSAAVSAERLFDTFLALLEPLGDIVHVILESSHDSQGVGHVDYQRTHIDRPVLASHLCDFEEMLLNDGCTGLAVLADGQPMEVQFDEHKLLHVYAPHLKPFRQVLRRWGIRRRRVLPLISEAEHLHHTSPDYATAFQQLALRIGVGTPRRVFSD